MKTHSIIWSNIENPKTTLALNPAGNLNRALCLAAKAFVALVPALAIVTGAAWLITIPDLAVYLQATLWTAGFVFFGLALESEKTAFFLSLATGFALPLLAWLSSRVAIEFAIVAAALLAAWLAAAIWRR